MSEQIRVEVVINPSQQVTATNEVWKTIMLEDFCGCCNECSSCFCSLFCPAIEHGIVQGRIGKSCLCGFCCCPLCCGCDADAVERTLGVPEHGCCCNCIRYAFCWWCVISQQARATKAWELAGKPATSGMKM